MPALEAGSGLSSGLIVLLRLGARDGALGLSDGARDGAFECSDGARVGAFECSDGARVGAFECSDGAREGAFECSDGAREGAFECSDGARTGLTVVASLFSALDTLLIVLRTFDLRSSSLLRCLELRLLAFESPETLLALIMLLTLDFDLDRPDARLSVSICVTAVGAR